MTALAAGLPSPGKSGSGGKDPQRAGPDTRVPAAGGVGKTVTERDISTVTARRLEKAAERAAEARVTVMRLLASGDPKQAFNRSVHALQAALAGEYGRRPEEVAAVYELLTEEALGRAAQAPLLIILDEDGDR